MAVDELTEVQKMRISHYADLTKIVRALGERFGDDVYKIVFEKYGRKAFTELNIVSENIGNDSDEYRSIETFIKCLFDNMKNELFDYKGVCGISFIGGEEETD